MAREVEGELSNIELPALAGGLTLVLLPHRVNCFVLNITPQAFCDLLNSEVGGFDLHSESYFHVRPVAEGINKLVVEAFDLLWARHARIADIALAPAPDYGLKADIICAAPADGYRQSGSRFIRAWYALTSFITLPFSDPNSSTGRSYGLVAPDALAAWEAGLSADYGYDRVLAAIEKICPGSRRGREAVRLFWAVQDDPSRISWLSEEDQDREGDLGGVIALFEEMRVGAQATAEQDVVEAMAEAPAVHKQSFPEGAANSVDNVDHAQEGARRRIFGKGPGGKALYSREEWDRLVEEWFMVKQAGGTSMEEFAEGKTTTANTLRKHVTDYNKRHVDGNAH